MLGLARPWTLTGPPAGVRAVEAPQSRGTKPQEVHMAGTTKSTPTTPASRPAARTAGSRARMAKRRTATSGKAGKPAGGPTKQAILIGLLRRRGGTAIAQMAAKTGWQPHSVRGAISGTLKKKLGLDVTSTKVEDRGRVYQITKSP